MPTLVLSNFRNGIDNRGTDAREGTLAGASGNTLASNFSVGEGGVRPRVALTRVAWRGTLYSVDSSPHGYRFNGQTPELRQLAVPGGVMYAMVDNVLCVVTMGSETEASIRPIWVWPQTTFFSCAQAGQMTYFAPDSVPVSQQTQNHLVRRESFNLAVLLEHSATGQTETIWRATGSLLNEVLPGDMLFLGQRKQVVEGGQPVTFVDWAPTGGTVAFPVRQIFYSTTLSRYYLWTDVVQQPPGGFYNVGNVARTGNAGIPVQNVNATVQRQTGGSLPLGSVRYLWLLRNERLGLTGVPSPVQAGSTTVFETTAAEKTFSITLPLSTLQRPAGTESLLLYRSVRPAGGGWSDWYLVATQPILAVESASLNLDNQVQNGTLKRYRDSITITDNGLPDGEPLPSDAFFHDPPPALRQIVMFNGRLYGIGRGASASELLFSTAGAPEYWPRDAAGALSWVMDTRWLGGYQSFPGGGLVAIAPESGAYSTTGRTGDNLLVFQRHQAHRWFGTNWEDFRSTYAFDVGCVAPHSVQNCGGVMVWRSATHLMAAPAGSSSPQPISEPLALPRASEEVADANWGVYRDGVYYFNHGTRNWAFDVRDGVWTPLEHGYSCPEITRGHSDFPPNTLVWVPQPAGGFACESRGPFTGGMTCITQVLRPATAEDSLRREKRFRRLHIGLRPARIDAVNNAQAQVKLYVAGRATPVEWNNNVPGAGADAHVPLIILHLPIDPPVIGPAARVVITLTAPGAGRLYRGWSLEWIMVDWEELTPEVSRVDDGSSGGFYLADVDATPWPIDPP